MPKGYAGITLYPFIFVRSKTDINEVFLNHEKIHLQQQKELLVIFFYLWYVIDFLLKYAKYRNWNKAYRNVIFEREAYENERTLDYLKVRGRYWFLSQYDSQ